MHWHIALTQPGQDKQAAPLPPLLDCPEYRAELGRRATERSMRNPIRAEIIPGKPAAWYAIVVESGRESVTAERLAYDRGFGTYAPEFLKTTIIRGCKRERMLAMFVGYVFVFTWDLDQQWHRIEGCPGVMHRLTSAREDTAMVIPDRLIDLIQAAEIELMLHGGIVQRGHLAPEPKKKRKRRKPRKRPESGNADLPPGVTLGPTQELVTISTKSYFAAVAALDDAGRNSLLLKALGLAS